MIYFTAHTFKCVCHCRRAMFRVLGMYNFDFCPNPTGAEIFRLFFGRIENKKRHFEIN